MYHKCLLQVCRLASSKAHFSCDLGGSLNSQISHLELHSSKMTKVPGAGSERSPLAEVHDERKKGRGERVVW